MGGTVTGRGGSSGTGGAATGGTTNPGTGGAATGGTTNPGTGGAATGGTTNPGTGGAGTGGAGGGSGTCTPACTSYFPTCCGASGCVNPRNDPENCGGCGIRCQAGSYCNETCVPITCSIDGGACASGQTCCQSSCCTAGQNCCAVNSPTGPMRPVCFTPTTDWPRCPGDTPVLSDRNLKKDLAPADPEAVLAGVRKLAIFNWSYLSEADAVRHLGPMAQDFHAVFGLGNDDRTYSPVDGHGVALAAIQALDKLVRAQQAQLESLERENRALSRRLQAMERRRPTTARPEH